VKVPEEFVVPGEGVVVRRGHEGELAAFLAAVPSCAADAGDVVGGRGATRRIALVDGGAAYVRRYVHGGLLGALLGDRYWGRPPRPLRELLATEAARRAGVLAPEVLAALVQPAPPAGLLYRGVLVTRALDERRALGDALRAASDVGARSAWIACAVRAVRRLHAAGIHHPDLNVANVLVGARPEDDAALIDFDRAHTGPRPVGALRVALARRRLARSIAKLGLPGLDRAGAAAALEAAGFGGRA
jgi:3-deoxy-D-manno-octulosonic acid kinase